MFMDTCRLLREGLQFSTTRTLSNLPPLPAQIAKSSREMCWYLYVRATIYRVNYIPANRERKSIDEALFHCESGPAGLRVSKSRPQPGKDSQEILFE